MDDEGAVGLAAPALVMILTSHTLYFPPVLGRQKRRLRSTLFFKFIVSLLRPYPGQQLLTVVGQAPRLDVTAPRRADLGQADDIAVLRHQGALGAAGPGQPGAGLQVRQGAVDRHREARPDQSVYPGQVVAGGMARDVDRGTGGLG